MSREPTHVELIEDNHVALDLTRSGVSLNGVNGYTGRADRARVHGQMRRVLHAAIPAGRVPARAGWLTASRDAAGARCPRCGATLEKDRVAGRGTIWCPRCQPAQ